jgi:SAM-dependent methyltransferase
MTRKADIIHRAIRKILPRKEYIKLSGSIIPSPDRRWCGPEFKDDDFYLRSAEGEANRLVNCFQCTQESRVLDVGCGQGRLPIGILRVIGELNYIGIDVDRRSIDWCKRYIERNHPLFEFKHLNLYNERYNKNGIKIDDGFCFEVEPDSADIVYLFSVFSHTTEEDMRAYLKDFSRILDDRGKILFTTFVEEDVPNVSINPEDYRLKCSGPLHIVRYNKDYLFSILDESGYSILSFTHGTEADGQSAIYLSKKNG